MKQLYTPCLFLLLGTTAQAQITITQAEMPAANDQLVRVKAVTNPFINYGATGPAFTWNFPNLAADVGDTTNYQTVASTNFVYAIVYADIFFNPNRANHAKPGTDIAFSQFLPIENPYTFRYRSSSTYSTVGFGAELSGIPLPIIFDQHDVIYELPMTYGDVSSSTSSYSVDIPNVGYYGFEQDRVNEVDGWGAITTPGGVFDVIRVKTTLTMRDSIFGFAIDRPVVREYKWLAQGLRVPVLQINTTSLFGTEIVNAIYYYDVPRSIEVVEPLAATLCPGADVPVNYTVTGAYNAGGFFVPANQFTAQLSDAAGSFAAPVAIGSVTSTASGTINATIPANTPPGTGYRIRVISTSPDFNGAGTSFAITIGGPPVAEISSTGSSQICTGEVLTLTAVGGPSYQWQRDGTDIPDATDDTFEVSEAGSYTVLVDNACGAASSNAIVVEVSDPPTHTVDATAYAICAGSSVEFTAHDVSGQEPLTYQWFLNNAPVADATDSTIVATLAGIYTAEVTNGSTGCTFTTDGVQVSVETVPVAVISADGGTTICAGSSVTLSIPGTSGSSYQWSLNGEPLSEATGSQWVATAAGDYTVVVTSPTNCSSGPSDPLTVTVDEPAVPTVIATEPTTFCEGGGVALVVDPVDDADYQWMVDGTPIDGAVGTQLTVIASGSYTVIVTTAAGCSATSDPAIEVVVYPLPDVPVITASDDLLNASGTGSFQWYLDGVLIPDATEATWVPVQNGSYTVEVTENGCSSTSEPYIVLTTALGAMTLENVQVRPNPSNGVFAIHCPGAAGQDYEILDATGKRVRNGRLGSDRTAIDMGQAEQGIYFLRILDGRSIPVLRIAITR